MLDCISYTHTPGGQLFVLKNGITLESGSAFEVLGVGAQPKLGVFEVKWKGPKVSLGDVLLLPVKGALKTSLKMTVGKVDPLITPLSAWSAVCAGPLEREFILKNIDANCDECKKDYKLEFIAYSADDQKDALDAMNMQGWDASVDRQVCPTCL
jgi:hypothetical protein